MGRGALGPGDGKRGEGGAGRSGRAEFQKRPTVPTVHGALLLAAGPGCRPADFVGVGTRSVGYGGDGSEVNSGWAAGQLGG
ncbi:hypothetical protein JCM30394_20050 [Deferrisoma palaeochoriense]